MNFRQLAFPHTQALLTKGVVRNTPVSMAIGAAFAACATLPSTPSQVEEAIFLDLNGETLDEFLNELVSLAPFDYNEIRAYAKKFYKLRHSQAFPPDTYPASSGKPIYDLFGFSRALSDVDIMVMHDNTDNFRENFLFFKGLVIELNAGA